MLQGMERFNGIFVCTTNLLDRLDQAALRRFTFKIKFMPLTAAQRERMFMTEALAGDASLLTGEVRARSSRAAPCRREPSTRRSIRAATPWSRRAAPRASPR